MEGSTSNCLQSFRRERGTDRFYQLRPVRGLNNRKEAEVTIAGKNLRVCILYGTAAAEEFLAEDMRGYHFVEVMTCPGGCISGAGQPDCGSVPVSDAVRKRELPHYISR